jgi:hypothetical protein
LFSKAYIQANRRSLSLGLRNTLIKIQYDPFTSTGQLTNNGYKGAGSSAVECVLRKCKVVGSNPTQSTILMARGYGGILSVFFMFCYQNRARFTDEKEPFASKFGSNFLIASFRINFRCQKHKRHLNEFQSGELGFDFNWRRSGSDRDGQMMVK